jgi:chromosome segregation ATPase
MTQTKNNRKRKNKHSGSGISPEKKKSNMATQNNQTVSGASSLSTTADLIASSQSVLTENCDSVPNKSMDDIYQKLDSMCSYMSTMSEKLNKLDTIENKLANLEVTMQAVSSKVSVLESKVTAIEVGMTFINETYEEIKTENKKLHGSFSSCQARITEIENGVTSINEKHEEAKTDYKKLRGSVSSCEKKVKQGETNATLFKDKTRQEFAQMGDKQERMNNELVDLQCRTMRDNLIFYNIEELSETENCMKIIQSLCEDKLEIHEAVEMDRAHRMGSITVGKIRPIVVKFRRYNQREMVRKNSNKLKGTKMAIGEQFPKSIQERRKVLVPIMKQARAEGKLVNLVKDRLYIGGVLYTGSG